MADYQKRPASPSVTHPPAGRFQVVVTLDGAPFVRGWWNDRTTAELKCRGWIGDHGSRAGARVAITDEETGATLTSWSAKP
ncbi:hypothetical protein [Streptomyces sp. NPDC002132]|uniref:hypothetical protein n=1 Tax=unclassified Streptomyces TaxID=2593676 RepID=UPI0033215411